MEVRAKKALGQHFLTDQRIARTIVDALSAGSVRDVLEIGPGMGVLTKYLLEREDIDLRLVELDEEAAGYLLTHFPGMQGRLYLADYLKLDMRLLFEGQYRVIGNLPYNISSQIFFKILDDRDRIPEVVCMIQKEVADRIAEKPDEKLFRQTVKTAFNQRRKTLRNALKPMLPEGFDSSDQIFDLRAERLSVEDFIALTGMISGR